MNLKELREKIYAWIAYRLPPRLIGACFVRVLAAATTGKYSNTIVPELTAMQALQRWDRIHGVAGSGKDEFYDSNRNRKAPAIHYRDGFGVLELLAYISDLQTTAAADQETIDRLKAQISRWSAPSTVREAEFEAEAHRERHKRYGLEAENEAMQAVVEAAKAASAGINEYYLKHTQENHVQSIHEDDHDLWFYRDDIDMKLKALDALKK